MLMTRMIALAAAAIAAPAGWAQEAGRPDIGGVWTNASLTKLTRPANVAKLVLTEAEARDVLSNTTVLGFTTPGTTPAPDFTAPEEGAPTKGGADFGVKAYDDFWISPGDRLAVVKGEIRSSYIVDPPSGQIPYSEATLAAMAERRKGVNRYATGIGGNEGPEATNLAERCLIGFGNTGGPGMLSVLYNNTHQFVQTPDHVMILVEMAHDVRIIPTFASAAKARASHKPSAIKPWLGDSVSWYEDGALVVETINVRPEQAQGSAITLSPGGKVTERFTRVSDKEIFYAFTVEDAALYAQPWTAELSFYATDKQVYEYACHEGNYAMPGILAGARLQERQAAKARKSGKRG
ncbi:MAG: hypothetical protein SGJ21_04210 [Alphaproteobacteria bacterium]|nr:hypothetical protein [Alphaproteobacteria bacterium]